MTTFIFNLIKQSKMIWLFSLLIIAISICLPMAFIPNIEKTQTVLDTLNKSESVAIGFTKYTEKDNTYVYYEKSVSIYKDEDRLKAIVLQEIDDCNYDNNSYINSLNIKQGVFSRLEKNEIAVSSSLAKENEINIGDELYYYRDFNTVTLKVKYIYSEIYSIYDIDITEPTGSVIISARNGKLNDIDNSNIHFIEKGDASQYKDIKLKWKDEEKIEDILTRNIIGFSMSYILGLLISSILLIVETLPKYKRLISYGVGSKIFVFALMLILLVQILPSALGLIIACLVLGNWYSIIIGSIFLLLDIIIYELIIGILLKGGHYGIIRN